MVLNALADVKWDDFWELLKTIAGRKNSIAHPQNTRAFEENRKLQEEKDNM